jgi:hypothetical protein
MAQNATTHGFQAGNIDAIRTERVVCVVKRGDRRRKAFQVFFGPDRSLFVTFPYFRNRVGILSSSKIPASSTKDVNSAKKTVIDFEMQQSEAFKFVAARQRSSRGIHRSRRQCSPPTPPQ